MEIHFVLTSCLLVFVEVGGVNAGHSLHASSYQIQELWGSEVQTIQYIQDVLQSMDNLTNVLKGYVTSWETIANIQNNVGDPAATYAVLRHVAEGWKEVDTTLDKAKELAIKIKYLASRPDREPLPNNDDVAEASEALAKLGHIYRFNSTALERGFFIQEATTLSVAYPLSVSDLASIGLTAVNKGYFNVGVEFLRAARVRASTQQALPDQESRKFEPGSHFSLQKIESLLSTAIKVHNHVLDMRGTRSLTHATAAKPYGTMGYSGRTLLKEEEVVLEEERVIIGGKYLSLHDNKTWMLNDRALVEQQQIERLCRGEDLRTASVRSTLSCSYYSGSSPCLLLGPFKMEVVSLDPHIAVLYEVISPEESMMTKSVAQLSLQTPHNAQTIGSENVPASHWTLKHVWLESQFVSSLQRLNRRLGHIAHVNLNDATSEPFMVANYGMGGEYGAHRDTHGPSKSPPNLAIGDRLASMVSYLQAPLSGGRLVFPWVGVSVEATEGATVIWWNLLASHEHDFLTRHAACPILRGHKWIVNKWVGYNAQWNSQPCPVDSSRKIGLG